MQLRILMMDEHIPRSRTLHQALLQKEPNLYIVHAHSLEEGLSSFNPSFDIILLDIGLPGIDGMSVIQHIKEKTTCPVIVIANSSVQDATKIVQAISVGATEYVRRQTNYQDFVLTILQKMKAIKINNDTEERERKGSQQSFLEMTTNKPKVSQGKKQQKLIIIGTSTGGPRALQQLFQDLPTDFTTPILIVQHMPSGFTKSLAERLNRFSSMEVKEAADGDAIQKGNAYIAPGNFHLCVKVNPDDTSLQVELLQGKSHLLHRPSVDVLFESVAELHHVEKIAVILTGMGKDGKNGVMRLKELDKEAVIIVESPETAIIDGMPRAAIESQLVTKIIRIDQLGKALGNME